MSGLIINEGINDQSKHWGSGALMEQKKAGVYERLQPSRYMKPGSSWWVQPGGGGRAPVVVLEGMVRTAGMDGTAERCMASTPDRCGSSAWIVHPPCYGIVVRCT